MSDPNLGPYFPFALAALLVFVALTVALSSRTVKVNAAIFSGLLTPIDELLRSRDKINAKLQPIIDRQTEPWGVKVTTVELKDAQLAESMVRGLARQAEAEREKRAEIIATEGEFQAAQVLANAAEIISTQPAALALRYMQTLLDMGSNQNSTIVFPIPIELIRPLLAAPVPTKGVAMTTRQAPHGADPSPDRARGGALREATRTFVPGR